MLGLLVVAAIQMCSVHVRYKSVRIQAHLQKRPVEDEKYQMDNKPLPTCTYICEYMWLIDTYEKITINI